MVCVDETKWRAFRFKCLKRGTTITKQLDIFLDKFLSGEQDGK